MKLLVITQKVDRDDPVLGFFHSWLAQFAKQFDEILVVCLEEGHHELPVNVKVLSLGKEHNQSKLDYIERFYSYIWKYRKRYDAVFVHMNEEYVLLGAILWRFLGKKVTFWRNHPEGTFLTKIAVAFSHQVFCTSPSSFTAKFGKTILMPVGVDTELFVPQLGDSSAKKNSLLLLGRISPIKNVDLFVEVIRLVWKKGVSVEGKIVGDTSPRDVGYLDKVRNLVNTYDLSKNITFSSGMNHKDTVSEYMTHEIFINLTPPGSLDKTIFEAMSCARPVVFRSKPAQGEIPSVCLVSSEDPEEIASHVITLFNMRPEERGDLGQQLRRYVEEFHSLKKLAKDLRAYYNVKP